MIMTRRRFILTAAGVLVPALPKVVAAQGPFVDLRPKTVKPPFGAAQVNWGHPFAQGLRLLELFTAGVTGPASSTHTYGRDLIGQRLGILVESGVTTQRVINAQGLALLMDTAAGSSYLHWGDSSLLLPTARVTVLYERRKTDTTLRASSHFGVISGSGTNILNAHCPWNDGTVYWDFGGNAGSNRITYSWASTTQVERFVFVAGARGSAIYLDGVSKASQSTGITRTAVSNNFALNHGSATNGDVQEVNLFAVLDAEWTAAQVREWTTTPYAFLQPVIRRRWFVPAAGVATTWPGWMISRGGWS